MCHSFHKNIKQHNCILEGFLKDHVKLKTGVMAAEIQLSHYRNKLRDKLY